MTKERFVLLLDEQRQSGLNIKDFCFNSAYSVSNFYYWKRKYGQTHSGKSSERKAQPVSSGLAPVSIQPPAISLPEIQSQEKAFQEEIVIELPGGMVAYFRGEQASESALQLLTQICLSHV